MIFNSFQFLWLMPLIFLAYHALNMIANTRAGGYISSSSGNFFLLLVSYLLYAQWNLFFTLVLLWVTAITYVAALLIEKHRIKCKTIIISSMIGALLPLVVFKYSNFLIENINHLRIGPSMTGLNWAIPLGLSFYSFQATGYLLDVYKQRIKAEHNWWHYMLFVSFFPQILAGPISKADELLPQIKAKRSFNYSQSVDGLKLLLWGMFMKVVFADRLGIYVDMIYNTYEHQSGLSCLVGSILYTFQIYGDFAGYSFMAVGVGKVLGFDLVENFHRPYFATSITEFWRRWHISLTRWLTTHVYIALGGNRCSKLRQYLNIMVTFLVSGVWHGANWTFILWGMMHGIFQVIEKMLGIDPKGKYASNALLDKLKPCRLIITFAIVNFAWILFRMPSVEEATFFVAKIFSDTTIDVFKPNNSITFFTILSILVVFCKETVEEFFPNKVELLNNQRMWVRWGTYIALAIMILLMGVFDSSQFIYVSF